MRDEGHQVDKETSRQGGEGDKGTGRQGDKWNLRLEELEMKAYKVLDRPAFQARQEIPHAEDADAFGLHL